MHSPEQTQIDISVVMLVLATLHLGHLHFLSLVKYMLSENFTIDRFRIPTHTNVSQVMIA